MPVQVGVGYIDIKPDMSGFSRDLKAQVGREMGVAGDQAGKKFGSSLKSSFKGAVAGVAAGLAAVGAKDFLGGAIEGARDLSEAVSKSNAVFKSSGAGVESWAKDAAKNIGLSKLAAIDAAGTFGNMFVQLGLGTDVAADMSEKIVGLGVDLRSFHGGKIEDVIAAQTAAFRGEYDSVQRFLPLINQAAVDQRALALTGKKTTASLTAQDKALAVNRLMYEGAGDAIGDYERTQGSLANQQEKTNALWANAKGELGEGLLPTMTSVVEFLNDEIIPAFKTLFTSGGDATGWAATISNVVRDLMGFLVGTVQQTLRFFANAISKLPFGWGDQMAADFRAAADSGDDFRDSMHASKAEILEWAGATRNADVAAKLITSSTKGATGAIADQSKAIRENSKATRDAAASERDLRQAKKALADLLAEGAVNDKDVADARKSLAEATRSAAHADRDLADAQEIYNEAAAAAAILGTDTALEAAEDAADGLADATENSAAAHEAAADAAVALAKAQAGDPDFQDKLADARDRVADATDKVADGETRTVAGTPVFVKAVGDRTAAVKLLNDELGIAEGHLGVLNDTGNIRGLGGAPIVAPTQPAPIVGRNTALPSNMIGVPNVQLPSSTTNTNITVNVAAPVQDPMLIGKAVAWVL